MGRLLGIEIWMLGGSPLIIVGLGSFAVSGIFGFMRLVEKFIELYIDSGTFYRKSEDAKSERAKTTQI
jgi:hypothetical protein